MNIKNAKEEIKNTVKAYLMKDDTGSFRIPVEKQRPLLMIGPPGIGKTAIMEQIATEMGINLVSYTITHHTRQSAIGLPYISKRSYQDKEYSVTEYTMSEIIASVYEQIEKSGIREGILFLDEINCVSETLAPTMLQFLQYKTFGMHQVPEGFVIVTAGNPPAYNKSVRDFDIVTLDRVRKIEIEEDFPAWKDYAYRSGIHGAILSYLEIKKENFYSVKADVNGKRFVTARGWEDLSRIMGVYEAMKLPVTAELVEEYLEDPEIAGDFANYYELYNRYQNEYRIPEILEGNFPEDTSRMLSAPFDERLSLIGLMVDALNQEFRLYAQELQVQRGLFEELKQLKAAMKTPASGEGETASASRLLRENVEFLQIQLRKKTEARLLSREELRNQKLILQRMEQWETRLRQEGDTFDNLKKWFGEAEEARKAEIQQTGRHLTNGLEFMARTFGEGQELVIFLTDLSRGYYSLKFVSECGNDAYYRFNQFLLLKDRRSELRNEVLGMLELE